MNKKRQTLPMITSLAFLIIVVLVALFSYGAPSIAAPPPGTPTNTPDVPPTNTDTPQPPPTNTDTPQPPPTNTDTPQPPPSATHTNAPPPQKPKPDPNCQSSVSGFVTNSAGRAVAGASVTIQGEGWSSGMLTDDNGRYGFAGLCPGNATLQAILPNGQALPAVTIALDGQNDQQVNLGTQAPAATVSPSPTPSATRKAAAQTPTGEPGMPATGFPGWGVAAVALLAGLSLAARVGWSRHTRDRARGPH